MTRQRHFSPLWYVRIAIEVREIQKKKIEEETRALSPAELR